MLTDKEILEAIKFERIKIDPFDLERLGPVSYDITTKIVKRVGNISKLVSVEKFELSRNMVGLIVPRSRIAKLGLFTSYGPLIDPGYRGKLIFLVLTQDSYRRKLSDLFQIIFFKVGEVMEAYNERKKSTAMDREGF